jgi:ABC-type xylose transport system permease subunit
MKNKRRLILICGDVVVFALVTLFGFSSHQTLGTAGARMLTTFIPLVVGWGLIAPFLGVYDPVRAADGRQLWRPFWAMVLAGPMVGWLRGVWLGQVILPIFVVVLGGVSALAILAWRAVFYLVASRMK